MTDADARYVVAHMNVNVMDACFRFVSSLMVVRFRQLAGVPATACSELASL